MATNEQHRYANHLSLPVPLGTVAGDPVQVGLLNGVAQTSAGEGGNPAGHASVWLDGSHWFQVDGQTSIGDPVYFGEEGLTRDVDSGYVYGHAITEPRDEDGAVAVKLAQGVFVSGVGAGA